MHKLKLLRAALAAAACVIPAAALAQPGAVLPPDLQKRLNGLPMDGEAAIRIGLPIGGGTQSVFEIRDSRTLPPALAAKFPGLRSFRGTDAEGRNVRLDLSAAGVRMSVRDGSREWTLRARTTAEWTAAASGGPETAPFEAEAAPHPRTGKTMDAMARVPPMRGGNVRYDFRLAVAVSSRYAAKFGGTVEGALAEVVHAVNLANEVFETDVGVHFTLVDRSERLMRVRASRDPFRREDPGPAAVRLIDREIGAANYDIGHALTDYYGGESHVGTSCSDDRDADFLATHKAAAWSGHAHPDTEPHAIGFMIHVLGRQLGAWPIANGCSRSTPDGLALEPGSGSTAMGYAPSGCGAAQALQPYADRYFHAANIDQMQGWLASRGGRCASKRINSASAPWIDPEPLAAQAVIPARTPFVLEAEAEPTMPGRRLSYTWEQMDAGDAQRGPLADRGNGPLFRSFPPTASGRRVFPRPAAVLGHEMPTPGELLPTTTRALDFRLTVRDNGGDTSTVAYADTRLQVIDTGRPFAVLRIDPSAAAVAGMPVTLRWDVAGTDREPISCHFVEIDLSLDGGATWLTPALAIDERNDGEAHPRLPSDAASEHARFRVRCDWRPFFAVSPEDFIIASAAAN